MIKREARHAAYRAVADHIRELLDPSVPLYMEDGETEYSGKEQALIKECIADLRQDFYNKSIKHTRDVKEIDEM